jgi:uncharacterized protein YndB with AHSA1/START domain
MLLPGHTEHRFVSGQYCCLEEGRVLSFTWAWEPHSPSTRETQVTVELRPQGDGTDLTLIHERFRDESDRDSHAQGWRGCLERLGRKLGG